VTVIKHVGSCSSYSKHDGLYAWLGHVNVGGLCLLQQHDDGSQRPQSR